MRSSLLLTLFVVAGCTSDTFTDADASDAASDDSSSDAPLDVSKDAPVDVLSDGIVPFEAGGGDASESCVNGNVVCPGTAPCCTVKSSPNYGKCEPTTQCL